MTDQHRPNDESEPRLLEECIFGLEEARERGEVLAKERERLEDYQKLLLAILDGSMNGVTLSIDDQFVWANKGFTDILGWSFNEIRGKKTSFIFRDENEFGVVNKQLIQDLKEENRFSYESSFLHKNGSSVACLLTGRLVDTKDWSKGVVFSLTDIGQRIQSEKALRESEQKYRALIDHSPSGTCLCQDKNIVFLNKRFADILGYSQDELLNAPFPKILASESLSDFEKFAASTEEGGEFRVHAEFLAVSSTGESRTLEAWINRIEHCGRPAMLMNFFDITSRKRTEEKIQLSEDKLRWELTLNKALTELYVSVLSTSCTTADISRGLLEKALALTNSEEGFVCEIGNKSRRITFHAYTAFFDRLAKMKTKQLASIIQETPE
ncbi:MAG: PAS domain-containing protein, partial [Desulfomonilaceae bacterium]